MPPLVGLHIYSRSNDVKFVRAPSAKWTLFPTKLK